jgi:hypothetical protein
MLELDLEVRQEPQRLVYVQEEPALEIALPHVFEQPPLVTLQRGRLPHVEAVAAEIVRYQEANPAGALGPAYQELVAEFQPLFLWAIACWDYLLSTEGCRFVPRTNGQKYGVRGDYRVVTDKDYSRMIHKIFRDCVLEFARAPGAASLSQWLRQRFWPTTLDSYRRLENPPDARQRILTPYSYLRCVPYQFLNEFHHELVYTTVQRLPEREIRALDAYFFHFYTETASADALGCSPDELLLLLRQALVKLLVNDRLVYCLLRQIERY